MESGASWAGVATVAWASAVAVVSSVAIYRARARGRDDGSVPQGMRVLMIRPCAGNEPGLKNALRSVALVRSKTRPDIRMTVASPRDLAREPTLAAAQWLTERGFDARAVVAPPRGPNHKIGQLAEIADSSLSDYDAVVVVDSDVDLAGIDLDAMLSPIADADSRLAATWCAPVERNAASTLGDRASAAVLGGSLQAFVLLGKLDGDGLVGKTFAVRTDALREIGGFGALHRHLGEDMEMARRLRAQGWSTRMVDQPVPSLATGRTLRDVVGRYSRWLMVVRARRARLLLSYPLLLAATPLLLLIALALAPVVPGLAFAAASLTLTTRLAVAHAAARRAQRQRSPGRALVDALLADLVLLAAFVRALGPARVRWRQRVLRLSEGGLLVG